MTQDEKIALLARAVLELAAKAAREWDYDGESVVGTGIFLSEEAALKNISEDHDA